MLGAYVKDWEGGLLQPNSFNEVVQQVENTVAEEVVISDTTKEEKAAPRPNVVVSFQADTAFGWLPLTKLIEAGAVQA